MHKAILACLALNLLVSPVFLDIMTTGANEQDIECPDKPYAMDGGQTDRMKKPK